MLRLRQCLFYLPDWDAYGIFLKMKSPSLTPTDSGIAIILKFLFLGGSVRTARTTIYPRCSSPRVPQQALSFPPFVSFNWSIHPPNRFYDPRLALYYNLSKHCISTLTLTCLINNQRHDQHIQILRFRLRQRGSPIRQRYYSRKYIGSEDIYYRYDEVLFRTL